jgi:hypothetical protein
MEENRFPWSMDKPIEEIEGEFRNMGKEAYTIFRYLLARLKKAESERDEWKSERDSLRALLIRMGEGK